MSYETIVTEHIDNILLITLNRPERLNAWTYQMGGELRTAIEAGNADDDVTAMVLTGAGRGFCAGADIEAVFKAQNDGEDSPREGGAGDWVTLVRESKPMVAAINGPAVGVGLTQVLPMDYLVAAQGAEAFDALCENGPCARVGKFAIPVCPLRLRPGQRVDVVGQNANG